MSKGLTFLLIGAAMPLLIFGCAKPVPNTKSTGPALTAISVKTPPAIDGNASDNAWKDAPALKFTTQNGPEVTMKAVYTGKNIFLTASWPDATRNDVQRVWEFDGSVWTSGSPDDSFAVVWNMNNSITGFTSRGCSAICHEDEETGKTRMEIVGPVDAQGNWPGRSQKADLWDLSLAISNVKGTVSDYVFALRGDAFEAPITVRPIIEVRDDKFEGEAPWRVNGIRDPETGRTHPAYRFKQGYNFESTPYPTYDQVEPITDYTVFSVGEKLPYMLFSKDAWSGSKADLKGKGRWADGVWTVEISRALDTGQPDDIVFEPVTSQYPFAVAIFNATISGHTPSPVLTLKFE